MPSSGGKERRRTRRGSRKAWSETIPEREREGQRQGGERKRGERNEWRETRTASCERRGHRSAWREVASCCPPTLLLSLNGDHGLQLSPAVPLACSLLPPQALRNGCEGLLVPGALRVRRHKGSPFKAGMLRSIPRTGGSSGTTTACPQMECSHLRLPSLGSPKASGAPSPLKPTRRPSLGTEERNNPIQNRPEQRSSTYPHPSAGQHDKHPL